MKMIGEGDVLRGGVAVTDPKTKVREGEVYELRPGPGGGCGNPARRYSADR